MLPNTSRILLAATVALSTFRSVSGHGAVLKFTIDGKDYKGPLPGAPKMDSIIRQVTENGPVTDVNSKDLWCGIGSTPATQVAPAKPGSNLSLLWANSYTTNWIHFEGPITTYMTPCAKGDCKADTGVSNKWFKIQELGQKTPGGDWYMKDLYDGQPYSVSIPQHLPDGQYLLRSELIALHRAQDKDGAEFYVSCTQLNISGGTTSTSILSTVPSTTFPGGYKATDPGILIDVYQSGLDYSHKFPGPAVATVLESGSPGDNNNSTSLTTTTTKTKTTGTPSTINEYQTTTTPPDNYNHKSTPTHTTHPVDECDDETETTTSHHAKRTVDMKGMKRYHAARRAWMSREMR